MMTDPISDMLTRIRNAYLVDKDEVTVPFSRIKFVIAKILERKGYVSRVDRLSDKYGTVRIHLGYAGKEPVVRHIARVSKPGRRVYAKWNEIPTPKVGLGISIVSTSQGLMTNEEARRRKLGGEVLCEVS